MRNVAHAERHPEAEARTGRRQGSVVDGGRLVAHGLASGRGVGRVRHVDGEVDAGGGAPTRQYRERVPLGDDRRDVLASVVVEVGREDGAPAAADRDGRTFVQPERAIAVAPQEMDAGGDAGELEHRGVRLPVLREVAHDQRLHLDGRLEHRRAEAPLAVAQPDSQAAGIGVRLVVAAAEEVQPPVRVQVRRREHVLGRIQAYGGTDHEGLRAGPRQQQEPEVGAAGRSEPGQVGAAVGVERAGHQRERAEADGRAAADREAPVRKAVQHDHRAGPLVRHRDVGDAVAAEVAGGQALWMPADRIRAPGEAAGLVVEEHDHVQCTRVRDGEIGPAVAVEVGRGQVDGVGSGQRGHGLAQAAQPVAAQGREDAVRVGDRRVHAPVAVEVRRQPHERARRDREHPLGGEGARAVARQQARSRDAGRSARRRSARLRPDRRKRRIGGAAAVRPRRHPRRPRRRGPTRPRRAASPRRTSR